MRKRLSMKKLLILVSVIFVLLSISTFGQSTKYGWLHKESWGFGFGVTYPRYISTSSFAGEYGNIGLFASIQKNYTEHVALRFQGGYDHFTVKYFGQPHGKNELISGCFDLLYYLVPCEPVSPYLGIGLGGELFKYTGEEARDWDQAYQFDFRFGTEWKVSENWKLKTELSYLTSSSYKMEGTAGTVSGGILGGQSDSYMTFDVGFMYYFHYGEKSHICEMYDGLKVDYDKIEEIVKKYQVQPTDVDYNRIEDIVKRNQSVGSTNAAPLENWVLIGINFDFNKSTIKPESIPILYNSAEILLRNPDIKVEIQGHTDNVGSENYNQKLSLRRAETVRNFLIAKGVAASRLTTVGMGKTKPIMDNKTAEDRGLNRRIEFKVIK
jgi:OOP family OmpA-OmpF porin